MTQINDQDKLAQFEEFFSIDHAFTVNIDKAKDISGISYEQFLLSIPVPFKMASDIMTVDQATLRPLQALNGVASQLVEYLNHQAQKIDLLVGYILSQQDESDKRFNGVTFGGGGIIFCGDESFTTGDKLEMKLFFYRKTAQFSATVKLLKPLLKITNNIIKLFFTISEKKTERSSFVIAYISNLRYCKN